MTGHGSHTPILQALYHGGYGKVENFLPPELSETDKTCI